MSEWQPIETAPKDGTWVLLWCPDGIGDSYYDRDYDCRDAPALTIGNRSAADWQGVDWYSIETYTEVHDYGGYTGVCTSVARLSVKPTHWQPIPAPPETANV